MSSLVYWRTAEVYVLLKTKCPVFHFLDLDRGILNLIYLEIRRKGQNVHVFLHKNFENTEYVWNLYMSQLLLNELHPTETLYVEDSKNCTLIF